MKQPDQRTLEAIRALKIDRNFLEVVRWFVESQKDTHLSMELATGESVFRHAGEARCIREFLDVAKS